MLKKEKLYKFYLKVTNGGSMLILTRLNKKKDGSSKLSQKDVYDHQLGKI